MSEIAPIFAIEHQGGVIYCDPGARCHSDIILSFGLDPCKCLSTGFVIGGFYCSRASRRYRFIYPSEEQPGSGE